MINLSVLFSISEMGMNARSLFLTFNSKISAFPCPNDTSDCAVGRTILLAIN